MVVQSFSIKEIEELIENEINLLTKDINEYQQDYLNDQIEKFINDKIKFKTDETEERQQHLKKQTGSKKSKKYFYGNNKITK